jgi:hypothetical protein
MSVNKFNRDFFLVHRVSLQLGRAPDSPSEFGKSLPIFACFFRIVVPFFPPVTLHLQCSCLHDLWTFTYHSKAETLEL